MTDHTCHDCQRKLTFWNRSMHRQLCMRCYRDRFQYQDFQYFDTVSPQEENLTNYPISESLKRFLLVSLIQVAAWYLGDHFYGMFGSTIAFTVVTAFITMPMVRKYTHPLDRRRFNWYWVPQISSFLLFFYIVLILFASGLEANGVQQIAVYYAAPLLASLLVGIGVLFLIDKRIKTYFLERFQAWKDKQE